MELPAPRGPLSAAVIGALGGRDLLPPQVASDDPLTDDDLQLALFVCYELHYRGWDAVDDRWEWNPPLLALRARMEDLFEAALRARTGPCESPAAGDVPRLLTETVQLEGPALSAYLSSRASHDDFREFVAQRSVYHLREADPHTFAIPRLAGRPKAALVEIQQDEYGNGDPGRMHQELYRETMRWFGLDVSYGSQVDAATPLTLAGNNLMSFFGLHRRLRGALIGQLAVFEMTSSLPNRAYGNGLRRLGGTEGATRFYDEHVIADAVHEQLAAHDLCGSFAADEPEAAADILFGARCAVLLDAFWAQDLLARFRSGTGRVTTF
jgi:heme oxygenase-like protein